MFVPSDDDKEGHALVVQTSRESSLKEVFTNEGAMDSLKTAAHGVESASMLLGHVVSARALSNCD